MPSCKAVLCGIDCYPPPNDLPSCVNDARAVERLLLEQYHCREIRTVLDREATVERLEQALKWLAQDAKSFDWLVFYYSGHGYTQQVDGVMEEFLVLLDQGGQPALWRDDRLISVTRDIPSGKLTLIMDCCYSGGMSQ